MWTAAGPGWMLPTVGGSDKLAWWAIGPLPQDIPSLAFDDGEVLEEDVIPIPILDFYHGEYLVSHALQSSGPIPKMPSGPFIPRIGGLAASM